MLKLIFPAFPKGRVGAAIAAVRVFVGIAFVFHGYGKVTQFAGFADATPFPLFLDAAAAFAEFGGGIMLILGLLTPLASLFLAITMATAMFAVHIPAGDPFVGERSWELAANYLVLNIALLLLGPSAYSADAALFRRAAE